MAYQDLEDYKHKAYGTEGHLDVKENQSASGSTDAPTLSASPMLPPTRAAWKTSF